MMKKKKNRWWHILLFIPLVLLLDVAIICGAVYLDASMGNPDALGHPGPFVTIVAFFLCAIITFVALVNILVFAIIGLVKAIKEKKAKKQAENPE